MKINGNLTFNADGSGYIQNAFIEQFASNPTGVTGRLYYNTSVEAYYYYNGTTWLEFSNSSGSVSSFQTSLSGLSPNTPTTGAITLSGTLNSSSGGTGTGTSPTAGQILVGTSGGEYVPATLASGTGISTTTGSGTLQINNTGVLSFSGGTTGLTPSSATTGAITLGGTLVVANGGTGATSFTTNGVVYGGTTLGSTAAGTTGQVLTGSTGAAPTFTTLASIAVTSISGTTNQINTSPASPAQGNVTLSLSSTLVAPGAVTVTTNLTVDGLTYESATNNITAAGTTQGTATALTTSYNVVTTTAAGTGVTLPTAGPGLEVTVVNLGANTLNVYPALGDAIDAAGTNTPVLLPTGGTATYQSVNSGQWYTIDPVSVSGGVGLSVVYGNGQTTFTNTGVTSFQTSLSGLTPSSSSTGAITLAGTLGVASGGTGATTLTAHNVIIGEGTSAVAFAAPGTQYQVLQSNGATSDPSFSSINLASSAAVGSSLLGLTNGGTNANLTAVAGAPVYSTASALAIGTAGSTGQAYISGGTGAPTWQTVASTLTTNQILEGNGSGAFTANGGTFVGSGTFSGVTLQGTVTSPTDAATKAYVDASSAGLSWKTAVTAATTQNFFTQTGTAPTYSNGTAGVGATLTNAGTQAALVLDGVTLSTGQRVLVKNETNVTNSSATWNGIYTVTNTGSASTNWVLTRSTDNDTPAEMDSAAVFVTDGTTQASTGWVQTTQDPITIGTSNIVFSQFTGAGTYAAGSGLSLVGNTFNVKTDGTTTYIDGSNNVAVDSSATAGQVLRSTGTAGTTATWGAVNLANTNAVTGTLAVGNGGTGAATLTTDGVLYGNGTSAIGATAAGTTGQVLTGNTSAAPTFTTLSTIAVTSITGTANEITASASTGAVTLSIPSTFIVPGSLEVTTTTKTDGLVYESTAPSVAAAGTTQGTAFPLTAQYNVVTSLTVSSAQGVQLPTPAYAGVEITIVNLGGGALNVYPTTGGQIDAAGTNAAIVIPNFGTWTGQSSNAGASAQWYSIDPVVVGGTAISVSYGNGQTTVSNTGVTSFSAGTTGFTPSSATTGPVTLAGTLNLASGGTNASLTASAGAVVYSTASALALNTPGSSGQFLISGGTGAPTWLTNSTPIDTDGSGTVDLVVGSSFNVFGTANEITTTAVTSPAGVTLSLPTTLVAPGSVEVTTTLQVDSNAASSFIYSNASKQVVTTSAPTNGQVLVGVTGSNPTVTSIQYIYDSSMHGGPLEYYAVTHDLNQKYVTVQVYTQDTNYALVSAAAGGPSFTIAGDQTAIFTAGVYFVVYGSTTTANNQAYTVVSSSFGGGNTTITVSGTVTTQGASGEIVVGPTQIIPQAVFLVDANNIVVTLNASLNVYIIVTGVTGVVPA